MPRNTSSSPSLSDFTRTLSGLVFTTALGCASTVTPPDSTPVYAEEIAPGVEPVDVEMRSTNQPEPTTTESSDATSTGETTETREEEATETQEDESATAAPKEAPP